LTPKAINNNNLGGDSISDNEYASSGEFSMEWLEK